jgi:IS605 OrfB family transposase
MKTRTVCCKLLTTLPVYIALQETSERFSDACNYVLKIAAQEKTSNAIKLHKLCYAKIRELFCLSANLAVRAITGWSFYQLQQLVTYKAAAFGIAVEFVNPAYTSQTCHRCLKLGSRKGERFTCLPCGEQHADVNASHVIALGGAACKPARISARKGS